VLLALALSLPASAAAAPVPLAQVGSVGTGAGQLTSPSGVAIDGAGNLYVADTGNNRISEFAPNGTFIRAFGFGVDNGGAFEVCTTASTCQAGAAGTDAGQLYNPTGIALDGAGNLYVADENNQRIDVFNTAGPSFTHAFGWDVSTPASGFQVCTTGSGCRLGTQGGGAGELSLPFGLALDGTSLYVADQGNDRISVFNTAAPSFSRAFGWDVHTTTGAFQVCTTTSTCQPGLYGGGVGQLGGPIGVALDGAGSLYVADNGNSRISVFNTAGPSFSRAFGWDVHTTAGAFQVCTTTCQPGLSGSGAGQLAIPSGVALDGAGGLYVGEQDNNRVSVFGTAGPSFTDAFGWNVNPGGVPGTFQVCTTASTCQSGDGIGTGAGQLSGPNGVATDCQGAVWVADSTNNRVQRFGEAGTPLPSSCPPPPSGGGTPVAVPSTPGPTGDRARAKKRCKKKFPKGPKRTKCIKKAKKLPV
jgi:DNA-binding beta-propeller fold protein YncE